MNMNRNQSHILYMQFMVELDILLLYIFCRFILLDIKVTWKWRKKHMYSIKWNCDQQCSSSMEVYKPSNEERNKNLQVIFLYQCVQRSVFSSSSDCSHILFHIICIAFFVIIFLVYKISSFLCIRWRFQPKRDKIQVKYVFTKL